MSRSRRPLKRVTPGDGCWLCQGRPRGTRQMQVECDHRAEREALRRAVESEMCPHEPELVEESGV